MFFLIYLKNTAHNNIEPIQFVIVKTANGEMLSGIFFISTISVDQAIVTLIRRMVYCNLFNLNFPQYSEYL